MSTETAETPSFPDTWTRRHLLDLESLSAEEIEAIFGVAFSLKDKTEGCRRKIDILQGRTSANLFFENSTRTRTSFFSRRTAAWRGYARIFVRRQQPV